MSKATQIKGQVGPIFEWEMNEARFVHVMFFVKRVKIFRVLAIPLTGSPARSGPDHVTGNGDLVLDRATRNGRRGGAVAETASGTENEANEAGAVIERRAGVLKGNERLDPGINYLIESYFRCEIMQKLP